MAKPVSIYVNTHGTAHVEEKRISTCVEALFDLTPAGIIKELDLLRPIYRQTAAYGHFGRENLGFTWEQLDKVEAIKAFFSI